MCLGVPGKILSEYERGLRMGKVDFAGVVKEVCLAYVPEAVVGDYVIVHVGFAISRLDPEEAEEVFGYLRQIGYLGDALAGSDGKAPEGGEGAA